MDLVTAGSEPETQHKLFDKDAVTERLRINILLGTGFFLEEEFTNCDGDQQSENFLKVKEI